MPLYEFGCPSGHVTEKRVQSYDVDLITCPCGRPATRSGINRVNFGGFASTPMGQHDFAQDYRRFREASEGIDDKVSQRERDSGESISTPFFSAAKQQAKDLAAKGVTADAIKT